jgi:ATP-dependent RNA helicase RhlE
MLFSATMPGEIEKLTTKILSDPVKVAVTPVSSTVDNIEQSVYFVDKQNKTKLLIHLLKNSGNAEIVSALVFTRTKHGANKLTAALRAEGEFCDVIHSNKAQSVRQLALSNFKSGKSRVLVATDIVSRGIDISELSHVINFNLPESPEDYVHRIGRTGRAGLAENAISFCDHAEKKYLKSIEKLTAKKILVVSDQPFPLQDSAQETQPKNTKRPEAQGKKPIPARPFRAANGPVPVSGDLCRRLRAGLRITVKQNKKTEHTMSAPFRLCVKV